MSNPAPFIPGAGLIARDTDDDESTLPVNDEHLDEGETSDSEETVEEDLREEDKVNDNLEK